MCSNFGHVYPIPLDGSLVKKGTPCYCGKAQWGMDKIKRYPKPRRKVKK